jgi:hypothetical protein
MYVICQNDYPLAIANSTEQEVKNIVEEIQNRCDEITKRLHPQYTDFRQIFIHVRKVPIIENMEDIDNKLYWNDWNSVAQYKREGL